MGRLLLISAHGSEDPTGYRRKQPHATLGPVMFINIALAIALAQQASGAPQPDLAVINARLGPCSADFTVTDADGAPVYAAVVHVRVRYGFMSVKRMDLEVGTNSDGKARVEGLPGKAKPLVYDVSKGDRKATVEQDLSKICEGKYSVSLAGQGRLAH